MPLLFFFESGFKIFDVYISTLQSWLQQQSLYRPDDSIQILAGEGVTRKTWSWGQRVQARHWDEEEFNI